MNSISQEILYSLDSSIVEEFSDGVSVGVSDGVSDDISIC
jgi:hypothetical protein